MNQRALSQFARFCMAVFPTDLEQKGTNNGGLI